MNETTISGIRFALDIALKATLLFSFTSLAIGLLRRSGAAARHLAGTAGLIGALALPLLTLALPRWEIGVLPVLFPSPAIEVSSSAGSVTERYDPAPDPRPEAAMDNPMEAASPVTPHNPRGSRVPWPLLALALWTAGALLVGAAFGHGILLIFFGLQHTVIGAMVFVGLTSLAVMIFMGMANTLMQTRTPDALRGRVMSVQTMVFIGFMPLGQLVLGSVGTFVGINNAFLLGGVIVTLLAGYAALRVSALRGAIATARPQAATTS